MQPRGRCSHAGEVTPPRWSCGRAGSTQSCMQRNQRGARRRFLHGDAKPLCNRDGVRNRTGSATMQGVESMRASGQCINFTARAAAQAIMRCNRIQAMHSSRGPAQVPARRREAAPSHPSVLQVRRQYTVQYIGAVHRFHRARGGARRFLHGDAKPPRPTLVYCKYAVNTLITRPGAGSCTAT